MMVPTKKKHKRLQRPAGYAALIERYDLNVPPNWHRSFVTDSGSSRMYLSEGGEVESYPAKYWPGDELGDHLEFALKYDGTNLAILASLFRQSVENDITKYILLKPTGKYARRLWFLYEFLTERKLPLEDLRQGNYVDLLDSDKYYTMEQCCGRTVDKGRQVRRQRINNNLLGGNKFCPIVRRTDVLSDYESSDMSNKCRQVVSAYSPELLKRALGYLYSKETKSSFELEHESPSSSRTERFIALLQLAEKEDFCTKNQLIELQNLIIEPRFRDHDYRLNQNYVGETVAWQREKIHFVSPKPEDIVALMDGLTSAHRRMDHARVSVVVHAAVIAYGFVFLHPFEDGNGRIHRFLIHNILARRGFTPEGTMFPISAYMLKHSVEYDASLESFSKGVMSRVDYSIDEEGHMTVQNDTADLYCYADMTAQVEALFHFIDQTIDTELVQELAFLFNYDKTKKAIQRIVDMPDRKLDLFIRVCLQNNGRLSARKRHRYFDFLTDEELGCIEDAVRNAYGEI